MAAFLFGVLGGCIAWVATMLLGQPLYAFATIRGEIARALYLHFSRPANLGAFLREFQRGHQDEFANCAARLIALTSTQPLAHHALRGLGYAPNNAAAALMRLASDEAEEADPNDLLTQITTSLKITLPGTPGND
jgi:hypothetical protein